MNKRWEIAIEDILQYRKNMEYKNRAFNKFFAGSTIVRCIEPWDNYYTIKYKLEKEKK